MSGGLEYITGVSWPRSGHHLLVTILRKYFGRKFEYCNYYSSPGCCKTIPCTHCHHVTLSKNHDYDSIVPILGDQKYLIQYRKFCPSVISNFELYLGNRNADHDNWDEFYWFADIEAKKYVRLMERWSAAVAVNSTFARISYEQLSDAPLATLETIVKLMAPDRPYDEDRLSRIVQSVRQKTMKDGVTVVARDQGVHAGRVIRSFRFYDEARLEALDRMTRPAYDKMARLPVVTRSNAPTKPHGVANLSAPDRGKAAKHLFVDATGRLETIGKLSSDVSPLRSFIIRRAIEDPEVETVCYEPRINAFRHLTIGEQLLMTMEAPSQQTISRLRKNEDHNLRYMALRLALENPLPARGSEQHSVTTNTRVNFARTGLSFAKKTINGYRHYRRILQAYGWRSASGRSDIEELKNGILLKPDISDLDATVPEEIRATHSLAFILEEPIARPHPEIADNPERDISVVSQLTELLENGAQLLCASHASQAMLQDRLGKEDKPTARISQFRPPSLLFERAESLRRITRLYPEEPFILCPSPMDANGNHLLLAKVWKQAQDEGIGLPKLICFGKRETGVEELRKFLDAHPTLMEQIEFLEPVNDVELIDLYCGALFAIVPSSLEGRGAKAIECLDFGLPAIVSTAPPLMEAVHGLMPILHPNDQDGWYFKIRQLADNKAELDALRKALFEHHRPIELQESWKSIKEAIT